MAKIVYIEIAGKEYPMSFSLMASKKIAATYGSIEKMYEILDNDDNGMDEKKIDTTLDVLHLLICQGCAYKNVFDQGEAHNEKAPVVEGKYRALSEEDLAVALGFCDYTKIILKIIESISRSAQKTVETVDEGKKDESPEVETT